MKRTTFWVTLGLMGAILLVGFYFVSIVGKKPLPRNNNDFPSPTPTTSVTNEKTASSSSESSNLKKIEVVGTEFAYSPSTLNFSTGDTVELTFKNEGTVSHNLTIQDLGLTTKTIAPGTSDTIEFTVEKTGTYDFFCTVDSHEALGMKGTIVVD